MKKWYRHEIFWDHFKNTAVEQYFPYRHIPFWVYSTSLDGYNVKDQMFIFERRRVWFLATADYILAKFTTLKSAKVFAEYL